MRKEKKRLGLHLARMPLLKVVKRKGGKEKSNKKGKATRLERKVTNWGSMPAEQLSRNELQGLSDKPGRNVKN